MVPRVVVAVYGVALLVVGFGFAFRWSWALDLWPWSDGRLSYLFLGSVAGAAGSAAVWIAARDDLAALQAFSLDAMLVSLSGGIHNALLYADRDESDLLASAIFNAVTFVVLAAVFLWSLRVPFRDQRRTPLPVLISCGVFVAALVPTGIALIAKADHIFPWPLNPDSSVSFGWILLASALYYGYAIVRPVWSNAAPQLLAFLVYDLFLIVPFTRHFSDVLPEHRNALIVYMVVIVYSTLLSAYYLFVHPATRMWRTSPSSTVGVPLSAGE